MWKDGFFYPTEEQLVEFEEAIELACYYQSSVPLTEEQCQAPIPGAVDRPGYFRSRQGELVISFDGDWESYLDESQGYNKNPQRWYVPGGGDLIYTIMQRLQVNESTQWVPGGRVFVDAFGAHRRPAGISAEPEWLLFWSLPRDSDYLGRRPDPARWPPRSALPSV